jgi:ribose transport system permease protein
LFAPSSIAYGTLAGSLPFAAILVIVGLGQMLVVQQGGFDLSVAGGVSLAVVISTHVPAGDSANLASAALLALCCALAAGIVNACWSASVRLNAIVATIGMNALIYGGVFAVSGGIPRTTTALPRCNRRWGHGASGTPCTLPSRSCSSWRSS